jgi:phenylpropionate dioxygenase-like ring-hydroxylating dioxygenase large terminal subunit
VPAPVALAPVERDEPVHDGLRMERYHSPETHRAELELVWRRVWQMACREEDIPSTGDHIVYDIGDDSLIVVRTADGSIKAYHNSCLHRGTRLADFDGTASEFRCRFHGFCWSLGGELVDLPTPWDFEHLDRAELTLPTARVGTWGGFVFVCMSDETPPLERFLENLPGFFAAVPLERRRKAIHIAKVIDCNWKIAVEAFMESLHVRVTHPQTLEYFADTETQYDVWPDAQHVSRMLACVGVQSTAIDEPMSEQQIVDAYSADTPFAAGKPRVGEGEYARPVLAQAVREQLLATTKVDLSQVSDSEILDSIQYFLVPNFSPWAGIFTPLCYRWRPYRNDPDRSIFEVMMLFVAPEPAPGRTARRARPARWLTDEETFVDVPELGVFGEVLDQDLATLPAIQRGVRASRQRAVRLSRYQESRIRHFHDTLERYLAVNPSAPHHNGRA